MKAQVYGIRNCDTVKKARAWLQAQDVALDFHDFRTEGLSRERIDCWLGKVDWNVLVNRRGQTWRKLPEAKKSAIRDAASAAKLMLEWPTVIKRPVVETGSQLLIGFDAARYASLFTHGKAGTRR